MAATNLAPYERFQYLDRDDLIEYILDLESTAVEPLIRVGHMIDCGTASYHENKRLRDIALETYRGNWWLLYDEEDIEVPDGWRKA